MLIRFVMNATRGRSLKASMLGASIALQTRSGPVMVIVSIGCDGSRLNMSAGFGSDTFLDDALQPG